MRNTRDTFIHFIADNIASYYTQSSIPVRGVWKSPNNPDGQFIQNNAINVSFLDSTYDTHIGTQTCMIDVVNSDELLAIDWTDALWNLLSNSFYTPQLDYSQNPAAPTATGTNVMWSMKGVRFKPIKDDYYFRFSCRLALQNRS